MVPGARSFVRLGSLSAVAQGERAGQRGERVHLAFEQLSQLIRSRPRQFFGTIDSRGPDWAVNRFDRKLT
jgi:hypothetical protein